MSKFNNRKVEIEGKIFDSKLEGNVYQILRCFFVPSQINCHYPVVFGKATNRYPEWRWKVDFYIPEKNLYVEAKGIQTVDWKEKLRAIDQLKPEVLDRLIVVGVKHGEKINKGLYTVDLDNLRAYLLRTVTPYA